MRVFCAEILEEVESHPYLGVVLDNKKSGPHTSMSSHPGHGMVW